MLRKWNPVLFLFRNLIPKPVLKVHAGEFVRGSYGRTGGVGSLGRGLQSGSDEEGGNGNASSDEDPLMGLKSIKSSARGSAAAPVTPSSPLFGATTFINPYSFAHRDAGSDSFSSSDGDAPSPLLHQGKKLPPAAATVSLLKLPAVNALQAQGGLLSGYDSWSEDDADRGGGGDDWSDTEQPLPQTQTSHKLKPAGQAAVAASSLVGSAPERVEAWAARHAGSGLLGLMLHMRRCLRPSETKQKRRLFSSDVAHLQRARCAAA